MDRIYYITEKKNITQINAFRNSSGQQTKPDLAYNITGHSTE